MILKKTAWHIERRIYSERNTGIKSPNLMEYITMCLDITNKLENCYFTHNTAQYPSLFHDKTHKAPYPLTSSREHAYRNQAENTKKYVKNRAL